MSEVKSDSEVYAMLKSTASALQRMDPMMHCVIIAVRAEDDGSTHDIIYYSGLTQKDTAWACVTIAQEVLTLDDEDAPEEEVDS